MPTEQPDLNRYRGWRRHTIGALAAVLIIVGVVLITGGRRDGTDGIASFALRVGFVLGALWLALPQLGALFARFPPWLIFTCFALLVAALVQPKILLLLVPLVGILLVLKMFGWFTTPLPGARRVGRPAERAGAPPAARQAPVSESRDSRSTPGNTPDKGG